MKYATVWNASTSRGFSLQGVWDGWLRQGCEIRTVERKISNTSVVVQHQLHSKTVLGLILTESSVCRVLKVHVQTAGDFASPALYCHAVTRQKRSLIVNLQILNHVLKSSLEHNFHPFHCAPLNDSISRRYKSHKNPKAMLQEVGWIF